MWGLMEKAKEAAAKIEAAAANIDQQLNESVGVEAPAAKPAMTAGISAADTNGADGNTTTATNVWNDDDFKFDDDDDDDEAAPLTPTADVAPGVEKSNVAAGETEAPAKAVVDEEQEAPKNESDQETSQPVPTGSTEADDVDPHQATTEAEVEIETPITPAPASDLAASFGKISDKANAINFMSPLSSVMTSINRDQEQPEEEEQQQEQQSDNNNDNDDDDDVPETPMKEAQAESSEPPQPPLADGDAEEEGAWQEEEDIDFEEVDVEDEGFAKINGDAVPPVPSENNIEEETQSTEELPVEVEKEEPTPPEEEPKPPASEPEAAEEEEMEDIPMTPPSKQPPAAIESAAATTTGTVSTAELESLKTQLNQREEQLAAKAEQMFQLQQMYEKEKQDLQKKVADTKDEAKKRIMKARERCEQVEGQLQSKTGALNETAAEQAKVVDALREEGQKLAHKQSEMERMVRTARGEARELREQLEYELNAKEDGLARIETLQTELRSTQGNLSSARKGETQAEKLDVELQSAREENSLKSNTIMSLEQTVKELKVENKELTIEVEAAQEGAVVDNERESKKLRKEHNSVISDLEAKLQVADKEAAVREDSLRLEVEELRKRWQDAVRRADALSMDVQSSTAPLLRQLESMERQHRARASSAAELETKLRAELEETVIEHEKMTKDHTELKTKHGRLERQTKDQQGTLGERQKLIDELTTKVARLEEKLETLQIETTKKKSEYEKVERLANEGVSKVRSEMSHAVLESEDRYRSQLETMKEELRIEEEKRAQLEKQVDQLLENAAVIIPETSNEFVKKEAKPVKLRQSQGQEDILNSALLGIGGDSGDEDDPSDDEDAPAPVLQHQTSAASVGSYAALEQLSQNLKSAKKELQSLRAQLKDSEKVRESLLEDLSVCREAKEKLPLFEKKVKDLILENKEKSSEVSGLEDDITEVKEMYRAQMNVLLEEKAAAFAEVAKAAVLLNNKKLAAYAQKEEVMPELVEDMF